MKMELLKLPRDFDFMMFVNCMFLFMIAFFIMTFNNGESTIKYINNINGVIPSFENNTLNNLSSININNLDNKNIGSLMKYQSDLIKQNFKFPYFELIIYWLVLPVFNISYGLWCWKKGLLIGTRKYKSLKTSNN